MNTRNIPHIVRVLHDEKFNPGFFYMEKFITLSVILKKNMLDVLYTSSSLAVQHQYDPLDDSEFETNSLFDSLIMKYMLILRVHRT